MSSTSSGARRKLQFSELPFHGKTLYLDIKGAALKKRISERVEALGGQIECFLSKDVHLVVTDKSDRKTAGNAVPGLKGSPFSLQNHPSVPLSRGQALLLKASKQKQVPEATASSYNDILQSAASLGVKTESTSAFLRMTTKLLSKLKSRDIDSGEAGRDGMLGVSPIEWQNKDKENISILKIEDEQSHYRPMYKQFDVLPSVAYNDTGSPFDVGVVLQKPVDENRSKRKSLGVMRGGYCESCDHWYKCTLREHLKGAKHREFVNKRENFRSLDILTNYLPNVSKFLSQYGLRSEDAGSTGGSGGCVFGSDTDVQSSRQDTDSICMDIGSPLPEEGLKWPTGRELITDDVHMTGRRSRHVSFTDPHRPMSTSDGLVLKNIDPKSTPGLPPCPLALATTHVRKKLVTCSIADNTSTSGSQGTFDRLLSGSQVVAGTSSTQQLTGLNNDKNSGMVSRGTSDRLSSTSLPLANGQPLLLPESTGQSSLPVTESMEVQHVLVGNACLRGHQEPAAVAQDCISEAAFSSSTNSFGDAGITGVLSFLHNEGSHSSATAANNVGGNSARDSHLGKSHGEGKAIENLSVKHNLENNAMPTLSLPQLSTSSNKSPTMPVLAKVSPETSQTWNDHSYKTSAQESGINVKTAPCGQGRTGVSDTGRGSVVENSYSNGHQSTAGSTLSSVRNWLLPEDDSLSLPSSVGSSLDTAAFSKCRALSQDNQTHANSHGASNSNSISELVPYQSNVNDGSATDSGQGFVEKWLQKNQSFTAAATTEVDSYSDFVLKKVTEGCEQYSGMGRESHTTDQDIPSDVTEDYWSDGEAGAGDRTLQPGPETIKLCNLDDSTGTVDYWTPEQVPGGRHDNNRTACPTRVNNPGTTACGSKAVCMKQEASMTSVSKNESNSQTVRQNSEYPKSCSNKLLEAGSRLISSVQNGQNIDRPPVQSNFENVCETQSVQYESYSSHALPQTYVKDGGTLTTDTCDIYSQQHPAGLNQPYLSTAYYSPVSMPLESASFQSNAYTGCHQFGPQQHKVANGDAGYQGNGLTQTGVPQSRETGYSQPVGSPYTQSPLAQEYQGAAFHHRGPYSGPYCNVSSPVSQCYQQVYPNNAAPQQSNGFNSMGYQPWDSTLPPPVNNGFTGLLENSPYFPNPSSTWSGHPEHQFCPSLPEIGSQQQLSQARGVPDFLTATSNFILPSNEMSGHSNAQTQQLLYQSDAGYMLGQQSPAQSSPAWNGQFMYQGTQPSAPSATAALTTICTADIAPDDSSNNSSIYVPPYRVKHAGNKASGNKRKSSVNRCHRKSLVKHKGQAGDRQTAVSESSAACEIRPVAPEQHPAAVTAPDSVDHSSEKSELSVPGCGQSVSSVSGGWRNLVQELPPPAASPAGAGRECSAMMASSAYSKPSSPTVKVNPVVSAEENNVPVNLKIKNGNLDDMLKPFKKRALHLDIDSSASGNCAGGSGEGRDKNVYSVSKTSDTKLRLCKVNSTAGSQTTDLLKYWKVRKSGDCRLVFSTAKRKAENDDVLPQSTSHLLLDESQSEHSVNKRRRCAY